MGTPASTPAPHTPINFVLAGGTDFFSRDCAKALAKCGYDPKDFGSYKDIRAKIKAANEAQ